MAGLHAYSACWCSTADSRFRKQVDSFETFWRIAGKREKNHSQLTDICTSHWFRGGAVVSAKTRPQYDWQLLA